jgi:hypothetical protein
VRLVSPLAGAPGGSGNLSTSLSNVARLRYIQNLCGFSMLTAMGQSFIMTLYLFYFKNRLVLLILQSIPFKNAVDVASNGERFTLANGANLKTYIPSKINKKKVIKELRVVVF